MITITLTEYELRLAAMVGVEWNIDSIAKRRQQRYGCTIENNNWQHDIEAACSEAAVAKWRGLWWSGNVGMLAVKDVGNVQVRHTTRPNGRLILHSRDLDDDVFVAVTGWAPVYAIHGWLRGHEGKQQQYWDDPTGTGRPAYFVPQDRLHPIGPTNVVQLTQDTA